MSEAGSGVINDIVIDRLGAQGDGVAVEPSVPGGAVFVPYALPGESVRISRGGGRAQLVEVLEPSANRIDPICRHFGVCGGCAVQHLARPAYLEWKRSNVSAAFSARGITADVGPVATVGDHARRRVVLAALLVRDGVLLGFHAAGEATIVDLSECPVMRPELANGFAGLRRLVEPLLIAKREARVVMLAADNGVAVDISEVNSDPPANLRRWLAEEAARLGIIRLTLAGDPVYADGLPYVKFGPAQVSPPPGAFLQASTQAENLMVGLVLESLPRKAKRAADLFCGLGAFTFPLAERVQVTAIDGDATSIETLQAADRATQGVKLITAKVRDLLREPLSRKELEPFDLVVFDPPRAGAKEQAEALAKSKVPVVVAVSCNPATLARDARILIDGGYRMGVVRPIDQFVYSSHVEAVAVFTR